MYIFYFQQSINNFHIGLFFVLQIRFCGYPSVMPSCGILQMLCREISQYIDYISIWTLTQVPVTCAVCCFFSVNLFQFNSFFHEMQYSEEVLLSPFPCSPKRHSLSCLTIFYISIILHTSLVKLMGSIRAMCRLCIYGALIVSLNVQTSQAASNISLKNNNLHNQLTRRPELLFKFIRNITSSSVNLCSALCRMIELFGGFIYDSCLDSFCRADNVEIM